MQEAHQQKQHIFTLIHRYSDEQKQRKLLKKAEELYLMHSFKIKCMTRPQAQEFYWRLMDKYRNGELKTNCNEWHKNQRRLFLWYLLCFSDHLATPIHNLKAEHWNQMSKDFFDKSPLFLKFQGLTIYKNIKKHSWKSDEEQLLQKYVKELGTNSWNEVSKLIFFHNGDEGGSFISSKQCRERWFNHVSKEVNKSSWTPQEDLEILKLSLQKGKKWSLIARLLNTHRTEHMVKNRYVSIVNKTRTNKRENEENLVRRVIKAIEDKKIQQKESTISEMNAEGDSKLENKNNSSMAKELPEILEEKEEKAMEISKNVVKGSERQVLKKASSLEMDEAGLKQLPQGALITIATPSTVKPICVSPFGFLNFGNYAKHFQMKRQDGSSLFSPFACTPLPPFNPSPFPQHSMARKESIYSPVGISALSSDLQEIIRSSKCQQQQLQ